MTEEEIELDLEADLLNGKGKGIQRYRLNAVSAEEMNALCRTDHPEFARHCYTGLRVHGGAKVMARLLLGYPELIENKRVLELGTGNGLIAAVIASKMSPSSIVHTDGEPKALDLAQRSVPTSSYRQFQPLVWGKADMLLNKSFDFVIGAELIYTRIDVDALMYTIKGALNEKRGLALLCHRPRIVDAFEKIEAAATRLGFKEVKMIPLSSFLTTDCIETYLYHEIECILLGVNAIPSDWPPDLNLVDKAKGILEEVDFLQRGFLIPQEESPIAPPLPSRPPRPTTHPQPVMKPQLPPRATSMPIKTTPFLPLTNEHEAAVSRLRRCLIGQRAKASSQKKNLRLWCLTWNVNGKNIPGDEDTDLTSWLRRHHQQQDADLPPDIIAIGAQEMVDLSVVNVATDTWKAAKRADAWREMLEFSLSKAFVSAHYQVIAQRHLVGVFLCVFRLSSCECTEVASCVAACGVMGMLGNKGGVSVRLRCQDTTICFVCAHMAAHRENVAGRNSDFKSILAKSAFDSSTGSGSTATAMHFGASFEPSLRSALFLGDSVLSDNEDLDEDADLDLEASNSSHENNDIVLAAELSWRILDHDFVFWLGDLNYRIHASVDAADCFEMAEQLDLGFMVERDQLNLERMAGRVFPGFHEGALTFPVTYKYQPGTLNQLNDKKFKRPPAWCDRVLWRTSIQDDIRLIEYASTPTLTQSDHKPVRAVFELQVSSVDWPSRDRALREATLELSRLSTRPVLRLSVSEIDLGQVRFGLDKRNAVVRLALTSDQPILWRLSSRRKSWLRVNAISAMSIVGPGYPPVELTVQADVSSAHLARRLNAGLDAIQANLIIHEYFYHHDGEQRVPQVKDHVVNVVGEWINSAFGARLDDLCRLPSGATLAVPPQLWRLLDALFQYRALPDLFFPAASSHLGEDPYYSKEKSKSNAQPHTWLKRIITKAPDLVEALDDFSNTKDLPVNVHPQQLAAALVAFLSSLAAPLIPASLLPTVEIQDPADLQSFSRDLLQRLPPSNYNVFIYLCSFARQLLKDRQTNLLLPSKLASLLADACLPPEVLAIEHPQRALVLPVFSYLLMTSSL